MKNARRHVERHCVASNVKPYEAYAHEHNTESSSRITHGTSLGNERDKHVSVTGPPVEGREEDQASLMPPFTCSLRATPSTGPKVISGLLSRIFRFLLLPDYFAESSFTPVLSLFDSFTRSHDAGSHGVRVIFFNDLCWPDV